MVEDVMSHWVQNVKDKADARPENNDITVVRRQQKTILKTQGELILELAEKLFPGALKIFKDARDENGLLVQPSRVRGIVLNIAQYIVKHQDEMRARIESTHQESA